MHCTDGFFFSALSRRNIFIEQLVAPPLAVFCSPSFLCLFFELLWHIWVCVVFDRALNLPFSSYFIIGKTQNETMALLEKLWPLSCSSFQGGRFCLLSLSSYTLFSFSMELTFFLCPCCDPPLFCSYSLDSFPNYDLPI